MVIKICSTIYLSLAVLFPSVPLYWHHESWVHKTRTFVHDTAKIGSISNHPFSATIGPSRMIFKFIKFYMSGYRVLYSLIVPVEGNVTHLDIPIFAAPILFLKCHTSANNALC